MSEDALEGPSFPYQSALARPSTWIAYTDPGASTPPTSASRYTTRVPSTTALRASLSIQPPPHSAHGVHPFPFRAAESLHDLASLGNLLDERSGYGEDRRVSQKHIDDACRRVKSRAKRRLLRDYYDNLNGILDSWREADEILDSQFPTEVLKRFGNDADIDMLRLRRGSASSALSTSSENSNDGGEDEEGDEGDEEGDEGDEEGGGPRRRRPSLAQRTTSAFSGFWFGTERSRGAGAGGANKPRGTDEESALLVSPSASSLRVSSPGPGTASPRRPNYGATIEASRLSRIVDDAREEGHDGDGDGDGDDDDERGGGDGEEGPTGEHRDPKRGSLTNGRALAEQASQAVASASPTSATGGACAEQTQASAPARQLRFQEPGGKSERQRRELLENLPLAVQRAKEDDEEEAQWVINANLIINILLLAGKGVAVLQSNSVSLLASLVDSALDLVSLVIIFAATRLIAHRSYTTFYKYPVGKARLEPLAVVIFAVLMIASFCQVLLESLSRLAAVVRGTKQEGGSTDLPVIGIVFMLVTIVVKAYVWLGYRKSKSSGVRAVALDSLVDVVFNSASLVFPVVGTLLALPWLDPVGGVCLSLYIISEWLETLFDLVSKLSGVAASPQEVARALYLVTRFKNVRAVSAFELYHSGDSLVAEVDIVLPAKANLKSAHDLGEVAVYCLESLGPLERAFVHLDYNKEGQQGHIAMRG